MQPIMGQLSAPTCSGRVPWIVAQGLLVACLTQLAESLSIRGHTSKTDAECSMQRFNIRTNLGDPVRYEMVDNTINAIMCSGMESFSLQVKQAEPVFSSGITCSLSGVPHGLVSVAPGNSESIIFEAIASNSTGEVALKTEYTLNVERQGPEADASLCEVTRMRSAIEDCGYAPTLEEQRQAAAISEGLDPTPPTPSPVEVPA
mmetsp:Transcript_31558/g.58005  ORF Transcript_31558/g.58005 Transcript_31558/m.58005 type:complete len:203 (+) Transcript_31558:37-645(+)